MQAVTGSASTDFQTLLQETQTLSTQIVQKNSDAQMRRGAISNCDYVQPGTYYADLCGAQSTLSSYQSSLSSCQTQQQYDNNGAG